MGMGNSFLIFSGKGCIIGVEVIQMSETVTTVSAFPELFMRLFHTDQFRVRYVNEMALVIPLDERPENPMRGFLSDGSGGTRATDAFLQRMREDKELDL
jgi:hypothetical protein